MTPPVEEIITAIESFAPPSLQESWDNTGWQLRPYPSYTPCTGVLTCLDVTPNVVDEAVEERCNLIISHHPLIFKGLRHISDETQVEAAVLKAIQAGIGIYSSHTALDKAPGGVSNHLGAMLGLSGMRVLVPDSTALTSDTPTGLGIIGSFAKPVTYADVIARIKEVYGSPIVRCSEGPYGNPDHTAGWNLREVTTLALCSGSGGEFIPVAIAAGADAYVTSDTRYHDFVDYGKKILIIDTGHFESEKCTKSIFSSIISEKFPTFAVRMSKTEQNPVNYI